MMFKKIIDFFMWPWNAIAEADQLRRDFEVAQRLQQSEYQDESVAYVLFTVIRKEKSHA